MTKVSHEERTAHPLRGKYLQLN